jgi:Flp pilus assembly secretin CpaC
MMPFLKKSAIVLIASALFSLPAKAAEAINVVLDRATILHLPDKVATIVIGNPSVADGTLQSGGLLVVTGKGYGATNLLALNRKGETLAEYTVYVSGPKNDSNVTIWRGTERETWNCAPNCEQTAVLGDSGAYFGAVSGQIIARNGQAKP